MDRKSTCWHHCQTLATPLHFSLFFTMVSHHEGQWPTSVFVTYSVLEIPSSFPGLDLYPEFGSESPRSTLMWRGIVTASLLTSVWSFWRQGSHRVTRSTMNNYGKITHCRLSTLEPTEIKVIAGRKAFTTKVRCWLKATQSCTYFLAYCILMEVTFIL